ncbi:MAG: DUF4097 family beta strand repeat-containing protein [Streptococcaceae bacterium]|jgi:DUF4097 and DUF4098 domain-containing protein YvlB|nr:DUF4097 family beta strand repeat-containing protein [Streptococcaceae bacterium]
MNQKKRILELVSKGIISVEEGIHLLEKLGETAKTAKTKLIKQTKKDEKSNTVQKDLADEVEFNKDLSETFSQMGETFKQLGSQFKPLANQVGDTLKSVFHSAKNSVNMKEVKIKIPTFTFQSFAALYTFVGNVATIVDIENFNGYTKIIRSENETIILDVDGRVYGEKTADPKEFFEQNAVIDVTDEKIFIKVPNLRIRTNFTLSLPKKVYDYVSVVNVNGDIKVNPLQAVDVTLNTKNGRVDVDNYQLTMLEVNALNGNIVVGNGEMLNSVVKTTNGTVFFRGVTKSLAVNMVNGDAKITLSNEKIEKVLINNVNGNIKLALPNKLGISGNAKTTFGEIKTRIKEVEVLKQQAKKVLKFKRDGEKKVDVIAKTTTGNIYLKDNYEV